MSFTISDSIEGKNTFGEQTEIITITQDRFSITLHKSHSALYRVEGSDDENKYESMINIDHFNGQECKIFIQAHPPVIEKLFRNKSCKINVSESNMVCEFQDSIISGKITIAKVIETEGEVIIKKISRQEKEIAELKSKNNTLVDQIKVLDSKFQDEKKLNNDEISKLKTNNERLNQLWLSHETKIANLKATIQDLLNKIEIITNKISTTKRSIPTNQYEASKEMVGKWKRFDGRIVSISFNDNKFTVNRPQFSETGILKQSSDRTCSIIHLAHSHYQQFADNVNVMIEKDLGIEHILNRME